MDRTDAGAHVGLADAPLREHTFTGDGEIPSRVIRPRPPEMALVSPVRGSRPGILDDGRRPGADGAGFDADDGIDGIDGGDIGAEFSDLVEGGVAAPASAGAPAVSPEDRRRHDPDVPAAHDEIREVRFPPPSAHLPGPLADVVDLGLPGLLPEPMEWQERALCAQTDPEAFFPEKGGSTREAKRICAGCEVRPECLEYALANDERFGIWGGMSERERRKQRRRAV